jgi:hypothetical protein
MTQNRFPIFLSFLMLFMFMLVTGCKSGNQQQATNPTDQTQQDGQPAANAPAANPPAQTQQSAPVQQAPAPRPRAATQPATSQPAPAATQPSTAAPKTPPAPQAIDLPAGTRIRVRLDEDLGSKISQAGDTFTATVADDVTVEGQTVIEKGARADGTVIDAKPLGRFKGGAVLQIRLDRVHTISGSYPVETSTIDRAQEGKGKKTAEFAGGGGAVGALIGGLAGHGKGALIGALVGAGAGTAGSAFTGNQQIVLPAETLLTFNLQHAVHITQ